MKPSEANALSILRKFQLATTNDIPSFVTGLTFTNPSPTNSLWSFIFQGQKYAALFDETANDNLDFLTAQVAVALPGRSAQFIENPQLTGSFSVPFKGKSAYLATLNKPGLRLDKHLAELYPEHSRSSWQKYIKDGYVHVNGVTETSGKKLLAEDDTVQITLPSSPDFSGYELPIIYSDDDVIVVNKPAGVLTHRASPTDTEFSVADFFARYGHFSDDTNRAGVVHRLDRDTSGIIIGARTEAAAQFLKEQFANRLVKKTYVAISSPPPKNQEMVIDVPIARSHSKPGEYTVRAEGKPAQTALKVVQQNDKLAYLELSPKTGRTHQLRVHLQYIGSPIVGDRLYGNKAAERLFLHAKMLTLTLPSGAQKTFSAPVPPEFLDYLSSQGLHAR